MQTSSGRADIVVEHQNWKVLFELEKIAGSKDPNAGDSRLQGVVEAAMNQIGNQYATALQPNVVCVLVFNTATRTLFPRNVLENSNITYFKVYQQNL